jgi:hypothetical protein
VLISQLKETPLAKFRKYETFELVIPYESDAYAVSAIVANITPDTYIPYIKSKRKIMINGAKGIESNLGTHFIEQDSEGTTIGKGRTRLSQELLDVSTEELEKLAFRSRVLR